jgi:2-keto-3-deoxy-L-fuconate dehydrogenase
MNPLDLSGKRVLLTQANEFMGPALHEVFTELGATVIADHGPLDDPNRPLALINEAGHVDVLLANLGIPATSTLATDATD